MNFSMCVNMAGYRRAGHEYACQHGAQAVSVFYSRKLETNLKSNTYLQCLN